MRSDRTGYIHRGNRQRILALEAALTDVIAIATELQLMFDREDETMPDDPCRMAEKRLTYREYNEYADGIQKAEAVLRRGEP